MARSNRLGARASVLGRRTRSSTRPPGKQLRSRQSAADTTRAGTLDANSSNARRAARVGCRASVRRHAAWDWRERAHRVDLPEQSLLAGHEAPPYTSEEQSDPRGVGRCFTPRQERLATGIHVPEISQWRITMTPSALLDSATIIVIANGSAKADAIAATLQDALDVARYPAQLRRAAGQHVEWIIDSAASARLRAVPPA